VSLQSSAGFLILPPGIPALLYRDISSKHSSLLWLPPLQEQFLGPLISHLAPLMPRLVAWVEGIDTYNSTSSCNDPPMISDYYSTTSKYSGASAACQTILPHDVWDSKLHVPEDLVQSLHDQVIADSLNAQPWLSSIQVICTRQRHRPLQPPLHQHLQDQSHVAELKRYNKRCTRYFVNLNSILMITLCYLSLVC
jgi:hypothetical protein